MVGWNRIALGTIAWLALLPPSASAADIVLTPPSGGGVSVTSASGGATRFRVDDNAATLPGNLLLDHSTATTGNVMKGGSRFIHNFGSANTFIGLSAGNLAISGSGNSGVGFLTLSSVTLGNDNTAVGAAALQDVTDGDLNTAVGRRALSNLTTGQFNIGIGADAGVNVTTGNNNILVGHPGVAGESFAIRIGPTVNTGLYKTYIAGVRFGSTLTNTVPVLIDPNGQLTTNFSSRRFKDDIADMGEASSALMRLRPVTFHYKADPNPANRALQYGLIAEEVDEVYPELVARSNDGQIETVMYQFLPPMLLNEFQKQQRTIAAQAKRIGALEADLAAIKQALGLRQGE
ncbi:hypothetical protein BWI17_12975 [Betaproteobacteria bacterium GR16-43]|nr:hypothetical protein BWI17_12975 [Betaproteobacteria bacterium GR16-43]